MSVENNFESLDFDGFFSRFSDAVRIRRQELGLTQQELVSLLKDKGVQVSQGYLSQIEAGQRNEPNAKILIALSYILKIDFMDFLGVK